MAFVFRGGATGTPLTPDEIALARTLSQALKKASQVDLQAISETLTSLTPVELERLLNSITVSRYSANIQNSILNSVHVGGVHALDALRSLAPNLLLDAFDTSAGIPIPNSLANMNFTKLPAIPLGVAPKTTFNLIFNRTNPLSLKYAETRSADLVTSIDEFTRASIRNIVTKGFAQQIDVRTIAGQIRNVIGLHPRWADAVVNLQKRETERLLKSGLNDVTARAKALESASRYAERLKDARATMIARTEVMYANNQGRYEGWLQASDAGYIDQSSTKSWVIADDERTCETCRELNGETVPWEDNFSNDRLMPPAHPNCRCVAQMNPPKRGTL